MMKTEYRELEEVLAAQRRFNRLAERMSSPSRPGMRRRLGRFLTGIIAASLLAQFLIPPYLTPVDGVITSPYFLRFTPDRPGGLEVHRGIDIAAPEGTPVRAARSGVVHAVGSSPGFGNYVIISHLFGWQTRYAHLSSVDVAPGALVLRGGVLGGVGSTGRSTGFHLHFEIGPPGAALPPGPFLFFHAARRRVLGF